MKNLKSRNLKLKKIIHYYMGFWSEPQNIKPNIWENLKLETLNWDSTVLNIQTALQSNTWSLLQNCAYLLCKNLQY